MKEKSRQVGQLTRSQLQIDPMLHARSCISTREFCSNFVVNIGTIFFPFASRDFSLQLPALLYVSLIGPRLWVFVMYFFICLVGVKQWTPNVNGNSNIKGEYIPYQWPCGATFGAACGWGFGRYHSPPPAAAWTPLPGGGSQAPTRRYTSPPTRNLQPQKSVIARLTIHLQNSRQMRFDQGGNKFASSV